MSQHYNPRDKSAVMQWAQGLFQLKNFYVLDTETTGTGTTDEICQIGVIDKEGNIVLDTLVKPTKRISSGATSVNGITNTMVKDAPTFMDLYTTISAKLAGVPLIAYNMDFDWRLLKQTASRYKLPLFRTGDRNCAMKQYARYRGTWNSKYRSYRWHSLTDAIAYERLTVANAHTAVGDVIMTLELLKKMAGLSVISSDPAAELDSLLESLENKPESEP
jgi:DNA polymerase-3 subunit epsilon